MIKTNSFTPNKTENIFTQAAQFRHDCLKMWQKVPIKQRIESKAVWPRKQVHKTKLQILREERVCASSVPCRKAVWSLRRNNRTPHMDKPLFLYSVCANSELVFLTLHTYTWTHGDRRTQTIDWFFFGFWGDAFRGPLTVCVQRVERSC